MPRRRKELSYHDQMFKNEVAEMFTILERCYAVLDDKSGIPPDGVSHMGYDYNDDYERSLMTWEHNSHGQTVPFYQRMLAVWRSVEDPQNLTRADIVRITNPPR